MNPELRRNFRETDWNTFRKKLAHNLNSRPDATPITTPEQLNTATSNLTSAIQETIKECVKQSKPKPDSKRWWNKELQKMRKKLNKLRTHSYRNRALTNHPSHRELRKLSNVYGNAIIQAKRQHWTDYLEDMTANDIWNANKYLKEPVGDGGNPRIPTLRSINSNREEVEINENHSKAQLFAKTFFPPPPSNSTVQENSAYPEPLPNPPQITISQIETQIRQLSPYKAHGPDEIPNVVLQKCCDIIIYHLLFIFRAILKLGIYYDPWREFTTVVLRKPGKPNYETPKAYRPIALLSTLAKVLTAIVAEDVTRLVERHQLLPKTHYGGRPGRTTTDALHYLVHRIKEAWGKGQVASVLFLDVEGAFPNAVTDRLIHNLKKRRIPTSYVTFIKQLLTGRRTRLKFDDFTSESIKILNGIGQGDPLSMILYILYNADLLEIPEDEEKEDSLGYVDDIALVALGEDFNETTKRLETMMTKENGGIQWSEEHNSSFEISKSAVLHVTRRTQADPENAGRRIPLDRPPLTIRGKQIKEVTNFKYLGIQVDAQLRWKEQAQRTIANATKWILQFRRLTRPSSGVGAKLMRQLYLSVALPKMTYGLDVWYTPPTRENEASRSKGSVSTLKSLAKIQRIATLAITGALRTTPTDLLNAHAGVLPMELALEKACHRAMVRMLTLPETHPLQQIVEKARQPPPRGHQGTIGQLLRIFGLENEKLETITPTNTNPYRPLQFKVATSETREQSIKEEAADKADFRVYSDGSGQNDGIGAAAIIYKKGQRRPVNQLKSYLGPPSKHNTFEGEAVGGLLATWLIHRTPGTAGKEVSIYMDNQALIAAIKKPKATSGQYLVQEFIDAASEVHAKVTVKWISSHSEVKGNEEADKLAKEAANGRASRREDLPPLLRKRLPTSASATRQEYHSLLTRKWKATWLHSPRRPRFEQIDDTFPFAGYRKRQNELTREQTSLLIQIRSGHIPVNVFLFRIGKANTKHCQECQITEGEETPDETVNHFLFECRAHTNHRKTLEEIIGRDNLNLQTIMSDTKLMKALARFIVKTGRFKKEIRLQLQNTA
jgi:ribonuclease HI